MTDRIAKKFFVLIKEKESLRNKDTVVDFYKPNLTLSLATIATRLGMKMVVFYDQQANATEINFLKLLDCELHERGSKREIINEINSYTT